ncbi:ATPase [Candidatus Collierbacteria bacterium CG10_big_fil_rev_8_21_14_0_10_43_36]|uniref:ATPase n=3 Tax=Candidatus Collieribacteriota TaxID=1752725 RepID=A0A2H0DT88_9BACT|nr:ATPase [bacterium]PIP85386.1 MAG: ATPase [Candidatus Collierbacteria bacterium CG22_combo_CG10-13_8_21_14_all_43_12]PIR99468.1 MAG: ATPase [Candidatus Collierbacteria bacterium CG10_big_fil_rev_8_21_14_0_10_43_36]PIZ24947.1 MAG: ATPase [Candidatus Collierbacteria bacterium CG_4_10_14_0_8_um_filter_43_86]PJB48317.1 MAG: ATPase [Candidatus Collierbacteria bacterium CG_4_9_14_3_um_filter_43_16]
MITLSPVTIIKASGEQEPFDESKLVKSLAKTGLSVDVASQTVDYLKRHLRTGITTKDIHEHVSSYLKENAPVNNYYNYGLKRAIMDLGPSGHPFETIVSDVLTVYGYKTEVGVIVLGKCVTHEIDVVAKKDNKQFFIECKFHNSPGIKTDVQVALYTYARYLDIKSAMEHSHGTDIAYFPWLVTNTKVTSEVFDYAGCVGLELTSWLDPKGHGMSDLIMSAGLHPVTLAYQIPRFKINLLLERGIVTCARLKGAIQENHVSDILTREEINTTSLHIKEICKT